MCRADQGHVKITFVWWSFCLIHISNCISAPKLMYTLRTSCCINSDLLRQFDSTARAGLETGTSFECGTLGHSMAPSRKASPWGRSRCEVRCLTPWHHLPFWRLWNHPMEHHWSFGSEVAVWPGMSRFRRLLQDRSTFLQPCFLAGSAKVRLASLKTIKYSEIAWNHMLVPLICEVTGVWCAEAVDFLNKPGGRISGTLPQATNGNLLFSISGFLLRYKKATLLEF